MTRTQEGSSEAGPARAWVAVLVSLAGASVAAFAVEWFRNPGTGTWPVLILATLPVFLVLTTGYTWMLDRYWQRWRRQFLAVAEADRQAFIGRATRLLRGPLTGVVGFAQMIDRSTLSEHDDEYLTSVIAETAELSRLLDDLVVASGHAPGRSELTPVSVLAEAGAVEEFTALMGYSFRIECQDAHVLADGERLRHVIRNLVVNACRYGQGPVALRGRASEGEYVFQVVDRGKGIGGGLEALEGEPDPGRGERLGIRVVRSLLESMEGTLTYRRLGNETHLIFTLPLAGRVRRRPFGRRLEINPIENDLKGEQDAVAAVEA